MDSVVLILELPEPNHLHRQRDLPNMANSIEIYVRHSENRALLMFHVPASVKKNFLDSLKRGELVADSIENESRTSSFA